MYRNSVATVLVLLALIPSTVAAQDSHYWSNQYGARAGLLGGIVVGSPLDISDTYYNPGALPLLTDPSLMVGVESLELRSVTVNDGLGIGEDLSSVTLRPIPGFFAITLSKHWVASILTRNAFDFSADGKRIDTRDVLPAPGDEFFSGEANYQQRLVEAWPGITWSHPLGKRLGVGLSNYVAFRSQQNRAQVLSQAVNPNGEGASLTTYKEIRYWNVRLLWKAGLFANYEPLTLGLTVTTPGLNLLGSGSVNTNAALTGIDIEGDSSQDSQLAANYQEDVDSTVHSPLSIAAGGSYAIGKVRIHLSAEWFDAVESYQVLDAEDWIAQTTGDTIQGAVSHEFRSVLNYGIGFAFDLTEDVSLKGGVATDFSAANGRASGISITTWDIYNISAGGNFRIDKTDLTFGLAYGFGSGDVEVDADFGKDSGLNDQIIRSATYRRLKMIFGFNLDF